MFLSATFSSAARLGPHPPRPPPASGEATAHARKRLLSERDAMYVKRRARMDEAPWLYNGEDSEGGNDAIEPLLPRTAWIPVLPPKRPPPRVKPLADKAAPTPTPTPTPTPFKHTIGLATIDFNTHFRPQSMSDVIGNEKAKEHLRTWYTDRKTAWRPLLLTGNVGIGKSSMARAFFIRHARHVVYVTEKELDNIQTTLRADPSAIGANGVSAEHTAVVLEDLETLAPVELQRLRLALEALAFETAVPFVMTSSLPNDKRWVTWKQRCAHVRLYPPYNNGSDYVRARINDLELRVGRALPSPVRESIAQQSQQDLRMVTSLTQLAFQTQQLHNVHYADICFQSAFEAAAYLFQPYYAVHPSLKEVSRNALSPNAVAQLQREPLLTAFVHENALSLRIHNRRVVSKRALADKACLSALRDCADTADHLSCADVMETHASHALGEYAALATCMHVRASSSLRVADGARVGFGKRFRLAFPKVLSTTAAQTAVRTHLRLLARDYAVAKKEGVSANSCWFVPYARQILLTNTERNDKREEARVVKVRAHIANKKASTKGGAKWTPAEIAELATPRAFWSDALPSLWKTRAALFV